MATSAIMPAPTEQNPDTGGAPVTQQPQPSEPMSFGKNNRKLPDELKEVLESLIKDFQQQEKFDRIYEFLLDRKLRCYDDGVQHFYGNNGTGVYQIGEAGGSIDIGGEQVECSEYLDTYNIARARRRTIDAVLTQSPPGIIFEPDKPDYDPDIQASETAEGYRHLFDQKNDVADIQQSITRFFELSGRVVAWTYTAANQQKWGLNDQGQPRRMETTEIFGTLESKVPIICRNQDGALYCFLFKDPNILTARDENPWLQDENGTWKIAEGEGSIGETDWERYARLGVRQTKKGNIQISNALNHLVTELHAFIRPAAFRATCCDKVYTGASGWDEQAEDYVREPATNEDGEPMKVGDMLRKLYPEGAHVVYIGKVYSESTPDSMDDCIDIVMSEKRDSLTGGALMEPMIPIQDGFNDFKNAEREFYEKGWPVTWFKGDQTDYDAFIAQQARPAQFALLKNPLGGPELPVENQFYKEPDMTAPETFVQCMEDYRGPLSQDITGASPALEGVAGPHDETASQRAMDKAQSMGILGPTWSRVQLVFAGIYKKAALAASKNPDHAKEITVALGNKQTATIQLQRLSRGSFHCKPDTDSTFPESTAAKRATLGTLLPQIATSPIGAEFINDPENWEEVMRIEGLAEDFSVIPAEAARKQIREIDILIREAPVPNPAVALYQQQHAALAIQAQQAGLPEPPYQPPPDELPSIQPKKRDYHKWELAQCQRWLSSDACWRLEVQGDLEVETAPAQPPLPPMPGYSDNPHVRNVELHADMHEQFLQQQEMAQQAMMPPPPAPKGAPGTQSPQAHPQVQANAQPPGAPGQPTI